MRRAWAVRGLGVAVVALSMLGNFGVASAGEIEQTTAGERQPKPGMYIPPNEQHPAVGLPLYEKSNHGVYVSVGTERSFLGAALTKASALYVIDYDAEAVRFARVNRALLAASRGRADYVDLRLRAPEEVWRRRSAGLSGEDRETLADVESWRFWDWKVRKNVTAWDNALGHFHTEATKAGDPFYGANYLFDEGLYRHLSGLAKRSRIWARRLDLRHEEEIGALCGELKGKGLKLGVIDTSDVPTGLGDGARVAAGYVRVFSEYGVDDTLFMNTAPAAGGGLRWSYFGFRNKTVRGRDQATVQRWYAVEMKKISGSATLMALLDDPDAIGH
jgi:hypothetical protein